MLFRYLACSGATLLWLLVLAHPTAAHTNNSLTVDSFAPTSGPAGTVAAVQFTYSIFHVGHNPAIGNVWRVLLDGVVVDSGSNTHANTGTGNETYTENVNVTIPIASPLGTYTITIQTLHSPSGTQGCGFTINNACRRTATLTFTIPADMSIDMSGLPTSADLNQPYAGSFTCTNDAIAPLNATAASCSATGLPAGIVVT